MNIDYSAQREASRRGIIRLAMAFLMVVLFMALVALVAQLSMKNMHYYVVDFVSVKSEKVALTQTMSNVVYHHICLVETKCT